MLCQSFVGDTAREGGTIAIYVAYSLYRDWIPSLAPLHILWWSSEFYYYNKLENVHRSKL